MAETYLKYMEQVELVSDAEQPVVTENTYLQRVHLVNTIDSEVGEPIYPDPPDPIEVDRAASWKTSYAYKPGQLIEAYTATFTGGSDFLEIYSRFRSKNKDGEYTYSSKLEHANERLVKSWTIPADAIEVVFYTVAYDTVRTDDVVYSATDFHDVVEELTIRTPVRWYSNSSTVKIGETLGIYTADFNGGKTPLSIYSGFKYKRPGSNAFQYAPQNEEQNQVTYRHWTVPSEADKIYFFCTASDKAQQSKKAEPSNPYYKQVVAPNVTITQQPPATSPDTVGVSHRVDMLAEGEYDLYFQWQFKNPSGGWENLSQTAVNNYWPRANYHTFSGERSCCWLYKLLTGHGPQFVRCRIEDYKGGRKDVVYSTTTELVKP